MVVEPLNLEQIFVGYLAGSDVIFFFLAMAALSFLAAKFRMPNKIILIMMALFVVFMAFYFPLLYAIVIFLAGLFFYYVLSKTVKT